MRVLGLIVVGFLAAACNGPDAQAPANVGSEAPAVNAAVEEVESGDVPANSAEVGAADAEQNVQSPAARPCMMQGKDRLQVASIRAVGTEPFWGARVEGRCVTYSTPENQQGVRVWARYSPGADGAGSWSGRLDGQPFEMKVSREADCSDGMSDKRYPLKVELTVKGEQRRGCAEAI